jgi:hypothetical protein
LSHWVRDKQIMSLEEAHWRMSTMVGWAIGIRDRGYLREGMPADIVVYDLEKLALRPTEKVTDLPDGDWRRVQRADGYRHIIVNGQITFEDNICSGALAGKMLGSYDQAPLSTSFGTAVEYFNKQEVTEETEGPTHKATPPGRPAPQETSAVGENVPDLYWNTRFPKDEAVNLTRTIFSGIDYLLETALSLHPEKSVAVSPVSADDIGLDKDKEVPIRFMIDATDYILRAEQTDLEPQRSLSSRILRCVLAEGSEPLRVWVRASKAGPLELDLSLIVRGNIALSQHVDLTAMDAPKEASVSGPQSSCASATGLPEKPLIQGSASPRDLSEMIAFGFLKVTRNAQTNKCDIYLTAGMEDHCESADYNANIDRETIKVRKQLGALSKNYQALLSQSADSDDVLAIDTPANAMLEFAKLGSDLHEAMFGRPRDEGVSDDVKRVARTLAGLGRNGDTVPFLQLVADNVPIPWGGNVRRARLCGASPS